MPLGFTEIAAVLDEALVGAGLGIGIGLVVWLLQGLFKRVRLADKAGRI